MVESRGIVNFLNSIDELMSQTEVNSVKFLLTEQKIKAKIENLLSAKVFSAGSQLLGLSMFDSDIDIAVCVNNKSESRKFSDVLISNGFIYKPLIEEAYRGFHFGVCTKEIDGIKVDIQLRSQQNIIDLQNEISMLPKWSKAELQNLKRNKILNRAIGGATYVNWKHDLYRKFLPSLILNTPRRTEAEMCISRNTLFLGQCTKRAAKNGFCHLHKDERGELK